MLGGGLTLGVGIKKSGLANEIVKLVPSGTGFILILLVFVLVAAFMTTFMSNTATANLIIPLAVSLGNNTSLLVISIALMC